MCFVQYRITRVSRTTESYALHLVRYPSASLLLLFVVVLSQSLRPTEPLYQMFTGSPFDF